MRQTDNILERIAKQGIVLGTGDTSSNWSAADGSTAARDAKKSGPAKAAANSRLKWPLSTLMLCANCTAEFLNAGSQVLQALTFFGTREKLNRAGYRRANRSH